MSDQVHFASLDFFNIVIFWGNRYYLLESLSGDCVYWELCKVG